MVDVASVQLDFRVLLGLDCVLLINDGLSLLQQIRYLLLVLEKNSLQLRRLKHQNFLGKGIP
jgi:hypothetical protein